MRSKALCFLLSLSLMFCVGFGSSTAYAYSPENAGNRAYPLRFYVTPYMKIYKTGGIVHSTITDVNVVNSTYPNNEENESISYYFKNPSYNISGGVKRIWFETDSNQLDLLYTPDLYDIYLYCSVRSNFIGNFSFRPDSAFLLSNNVDNNQVSYALSNLTVYDYNTNSSDGFAFSAKLPSVNSSAFDGFYLVDTSGGTVGQDVILQGIFLLFPKNTDNDSVSSVINAINNQTSNLGGKIDSAADDIQQSIEDQYSGEPGSSFPIDDIITQHNEKMGVLSFGSDTLMQVLGLLSPDQSLSSELVFPSMSLSIAGQRNKVQLWPEYRFDLNELKQHWPDFVGIMQSLTTALVWIFVLRYCYRVFEKYFLAGGGN